MKLNYTTNDYDKYMNVVNSAIINTESAITKLEKFKKMSKLSFEDWVKFQKGELKL